MKVVAALPKTLNRTVLVLGLLWFGHRHAEFCRLGADSGRQLGENDPAEDTRPEPQLESGDEPLYRHYQKLLDGGTKPNLAKLTIARQIASIALSMWRSEAKYDRRRLQTS